MRPLDLAQKYLQPFIVRGYEIVPDFCPFCHGGGHDRHTFYLNVHEGVYCCHRGSCGATGSYADLLAFFNEEVERPLERREHEKQKQYVAPSEKLLPATDEVLSYFASRKISQQTVTDYGVGSDANGNVFFPFYENNQMVLAKFRHPRKPQHGEPKEWQEKGGKPVLFGMQLCDPSLPIVITEGQMDAMALHEAGVPNAVSVPSGADNLEWLDTCWDFLCRFPSVILCGDQDAPGQRMLQNVSRRIDFAPVSIVPSFPDRPSGGMCKDANEVLFFHGAQALLECVRSAQTCEIQGLLNLANVEPVDPTSIARIKSGINRLDRVLGGFAENDLTVLTGRRGGGKSTVVGEFVGMAVEQGWKCCCYSGELSKEQFQMWLHYQFAGSEYIGVRYDPITGEQVPYVDPEVSRHIRQWYDGKLFLFDNRQVFGEDTYLSILQVFSQAAGRYGCRFFVVDNLMISTADTEEDELAVYKRFTHALKQFARRFGAHVLLVAHPRKTRVDAPLSNDDVAGNSAVTNIADNVISVEQPDLRVLKSRASGRLGLISCVYCPDTRRIYAADERDAFHFSWNRDGAPKPAVCACTLPEYVPRIKDPAPF